MKKDNFSDPSNLQQKEKSPVLASEWHCPWSTPRKSCNFLRSSWKMRNDTELFGFSSIIRHFLPMEPLAPLFFSTAMTIGLFFRMDLNNKPEATRKIKKGYSNYWIDIINVEKFIIIRLLLDRNSVELWISNRIMYTDCPLHSHLDAATESLAEVSNSKPNSSLIVSRE